MSAPHDPDAELRSRRAWSPTGCRHQLVPFAMDERDFGIRGWHCDVPMVYKPFEFRDPMKFQEDMRETERLICRALRYPEPEDILSLFDDTGAD